MKKSITVSTLAAALGLSCVLANAQSASTAGSAEPKTRPSQAAQSSQKAPASSAAGAVLVLVPVQMAGDRFADGCWVRFYDHRDFRGTTLTLAGAVAMPKMDVAGSAWRDWDSAVVGPKATVSTFDNENFRDRTATLGPGAHIADLRESKLGWFDEVHSARVTCLS